MFGKKKSQQGKIEEPMAEPLSQVDDGGPEDARIGSINLQNPKSGERYWQRQVTKNSLISLIAVIVITVAIFTLLKLGTIGAGFDLYRLLAPQLSPWVVSCGGFLILLLLRELYLRRYANRVLLRQLSILSTNLQQINRRIGFELVNEMGQGEAGFTTLVAELRQLQDALSKSSKGRGNNDQNHDQDSLPEPLGIDKPPAKINKLFPSVKVAPMTSNSAKPTLAVTLQDRVSIESEDYGIDLQPLQPGKSSEPIFKIRQNQEQAATQSLNEAIAADRLELFLQPIMKLPQRRLSFQKCSAVITLENGEILEPELYRPFASESGMMATIDNMVLVRLIQIARRHMRMKSSSPLFCQISGETLREREFFNDFRGFMRRNIEMSSQLIFSLSQYDVERLDLKVEEELMELSRLGYRFSMNNCTRFDFFVADLSRKGFRFIEVNCNKLFSDQGLQSDPKSLKRKLDSGAIDLVVDGLDNEDLVLEMLDYNVDFGCGAIFGNAENAVDW